MNRCVRALLALAVAATVACGGDGVDTGTSPTGDDGGSCSRPPAPGNVAATVSGNNVLFTWSAVNNVRDYELQVGTSPGDSSVMSTNTTQTNYAWNGAARGTFYLRVNSRNTCGSGQPSNSVQFTVG
jgi:hypothetical protein